MLVFSRKKGEEVAILGNDGKVVAVVTLVESERGKVRLGFTAHRETGVHRAEVYEQIFKKKPVVGE
jgi:carbon storage regulator CsrA